VNQADGNCNRGFEPESPAWDKMNQKTKVTQEIETKVEKSPAWDKYENIEIMRPPLWERNEIKHGQTCQAVVNCKWWKYQSNPWEDVHKSPAWDKYENIEIMRTPLWESNEIKHGQTCQAVVNCKWWKYQSSPWEDVHQQYATLEIERCIENKGKAARPLLRLHKAKIKNQRTRK
jgi:hypothetical protein